MREPTAETMMRLRSGERLARYYRAFELIVPALLVVVAICVQDPAIRQSTPVLPPLWANTALLGNVSLLAAAGLIAQTLVLWRQPPRSADDLTLRFLSATLILLVACIAVVLWKYLVWLIPDTWTAQVIFLGATQPPPVPI